MSSPISARVAAIASRQRGGVMPAASAAWAARWITGPSASGSENGMPTSIAVAPAATAAAAAAGRSSPAMR